VAEAKKTKLFSEGLISAAGVGYLIALFAAGFLTNFLPTGTVNTGTILLYLLACFLSLAGVLYLFFPRPKWIATTALLILAVSGLTVLKAAFDSNPVGQRAQELVIYFLGVWPFLFFIQIDNPKIRRRLLKTLAIGLLGLSAFGIFQAIFASSLPLSLFALRGDNPFGVGEDQFRPTGLTGNPIIFSSILVFASAFFAAVWLEKRRLRFLLALLFSLAANYLTYTRASVVSVIPVLTLVWLFHNRFRIKHKMIALVSVILAVAAGQALLVYGDNLVMVQRLQTSNAESLVSTLDHYRQIQNASEEIVSHPWLGSGMGSEGDFMGPDNVIITDGAWWILLLEFGIPLTILIVIVLLLVLVPIAKYVLRQESKNRALAIATLAFHAYILPASFINSALLGHISFGLYWVVLGLSFAAASRDHSRPRSRRTLVPVPDSWKGTPVR
jgi:O-antigen ligase/polysaccharide polymerase Wzy-like membrane protein